MARNHNPLHTGRHGGDHCFEASPIASLIYRDRLAHTQISNLPQMGLPGCNNWPPPTQEGRCMVEQGRVAIDRL